MLPLEGNAEHVIDDVPDFLIGQHGGKAGHWSSRDAFVDAAENIDRPPAAPVDAAGQLAGGLRRAPGIVQPDDFVFALRSRTGDWPVFFGVGTVAPSQLAVAVGALRLLFRIERQEKFPPLV